MDSKIVEAARRILGKDSYRTPEQDVLSDAQLVARECLSRAQRQPDFIEELAGVCRKYGVRLEMEEGSHLDDSPRVWRFVGQDIAVAVDELGLERTDG